jgi:uncharacterized protein YegL
MMILSTSLFFVYFLTLSGQVYSQNTCEAFIDLSLIIDSSGSVSQADFEEGKKALIDLVSRLNVGTEKAGVALINFASTVSLSAVSDVYETDRMELLEQVAALPRLATNTATGDALALAKTYCDARCRPIGQAIPRIFAVFTDGHSNEGRPAIPAADALRDSTTEGTVFAVGIGNIGTDGQAELEGIAGDPAYVMNIASYLDFARVVNAITEKMCSFPAFVLPNIPIQGEMTGNTTRYYRMHTLNKVKKNAFFEIEFNDRKGQVSY